MTEAEAKAILSEPLVLGDERQLAALYFLQTVAEAREQMQRCHFCKGRGLVPAGGSHDCPACDGAGILFNEDGQDEDECENCCGEGAIEVDAACPWCLADYDDDIIESCCPLLAAKEDAQEENPDGLTQTTDNSNLDGRPGGEIPATPALFAEAEKKEMP